MEVLRFSANFSGAVENKVMNFLRNYIKFHVGMALAIYRSLLLKLDKKLFTLGFNIKSVLVSSPARLSWDANNFIVMDKSIKGFSYKIHHQRQCNMAYEFGVRERAERLADAYFLNKVDFKDGDTFLDCGANVGDLKIWFNLAGISINYIGFEPSPVEFSCLKDNVHPSLVHNLGLWNKNGTLEFFISSQGADSSLIQPSKYDAKIDVPVAMLKEFVKSPVKMLKLEAEGAEPEILEGLGEKLALVEYISADLGYERGVECASTLAPVTNYLLNNGFELIDVSHERICALYKNRRLPDRFIFN